MEQTEKYKTFYSGSDWLERNMPYLQPDSKSFISPLGRKVADLLGELFFGIYHIENRQLAKVDWSNQVRIEIVLPDHGWGTYDTSDLTRLVFLAHEMNVKAAIFAAAPRWLRLRFHEVTLAGFFRDCHPTIEEALKDYQKSRGVSVETEVE